MFLKSYVARNEEFQFDLFDKICTQEDVKCHIQHEEKVDLDESSLNR